MNNTKDRAINLHDLLFAQLETISNADKEDVEVELKRTKGMCNIADKIISLADLQLRAAQVRADSLLDTEELPRLLC